MTLPSTDLRLRQHLSRFPAGVELARFLGGGTDGDVWETNRESAVKVFKHERGYYNERDTYLRLEEWGLTQRIDEFSVPRMLQYDDELLVVEMDMMHEPPYILDFAKVRLDRSPEFSDEVLADAERMGIERFEHHWPEVKRLLETLESYQIYYLDPQRGNITFPDMR
jgi:hypothetical protein